MTMAGAISLVKNPLTIIAMFAGLAEVSGTAILPWIAESNQKIYIYFLMLFPTFLVSLFFYTLHKKPESLYAPSDFVDEKNYMALIGQQGISITSTLNKNDVLKFSAYGEETISGANKTISEANKIISEAEAEAEADSNQKKKESVELVDKPFSVDAIIPSLKKGPVKYPSENVDNNEKIRRKLGSKLSYMAFKYAESKLGVNFDVEKSEMRNEVGHHMFDGSYFPPISNGVLTGDIVFLEVKVFNSFRNDNFLSTVDLINESWRHFKNFRVYLVCVLIKENNSEVNSFMKEISLIKKKSNFPIEIDIVTADELEYKYRNDIVSNQ